MCALLVDFYFSEQILARDLAETAKNRAEVSYGGLQRGDREENEGKIAAKEHKAR